MFAVTRPPVNCSVPSAVVSSTSSASAADDLFEDLVLFLIVEELGDLEERPAARPRRRRVADMNRGDPVGIRVRERVEQDVLNRR